jgi:hypothetical protein
MIGMTEPLSEWLVVYYYKVLVVISFVKKIVDLKTICVYTKNMINWLRYNLI